MTIPALLLGLVIASLASALYALPGLFAVTKDAMEACQTLLELCVEFAVAAKLVIFWSGALLASTGLLYATTRAASHIIATKRAISAMPVKRIGSVTLITDPKLKTAFTSGLFRPRIYISTGLLRGLEKDELRAVFFHELKHKLSFDPLKFLVFGFIRDAFFYLPALRHIAVSARLKREHAADDAAASRIGGPLSLASAMVKVAREGRLYAALADDNEQTTSRIRRLLEGTGAPLKVPMKAVAASLLVPAALILSISIPIYAAPAAHECTIEKCEKHSQVMKGCKEHCEARGKHNHHH